MLRAAIDLRRAGVLIPVPQRSLRHLFPPYCSQSGGQLLELEELDESFPPGTQGSD